MSNSYDGEAPFAEPADQLTMIADIVRTIASERPVWTSTSLAAADLGRENDFTALPMDHPIVSTLITPVTAVQFMADHLAAAAGVLRTRMTVLAFLTVVRSCLGAAALAHYTANPDCDTRERVRRALNVMLDSDKEMMLFSGVNNPAAWEAYDAHRMLLMSGAFKAGWSVKPREFKNDRRRPGDARIKDWTVGDEGHPSEMGLFRLLIDLPSNPADNPPISDTLYRMLSAAAHVKPHALLPMIDRASLKVSDIEDGPVPGMTDATSSLTGEMLLLLLMVLGMSVHQVLSRCSQLFGWDLRDWLTRGWPVVLEWRRLTGKPSTIAPGLFLPQRYRFV